jgi:lysine 2,3-aminomutase
MPTPDWMNSIRQAFKSSRELASYLEVDLPKLDYPVLVPKALAEKIKLRGPNSALWKQFVPHEDESLEQGMDDPIADAAHSPTPMIVHRYKNRALFLTTQRCPVICRYCFRKNELYTEHEAFGQQRDQALNYLKDHTEIQEVIFSGGDPLILSNSKLKSYLDELEKISHLKYLRFHSRTPVVLPERVDKGLLELLSQTKQKYLQTTVVIHCNHLDELDPQVEMACHDLIGHGISVLSQSVLMKGINDDIEELTALFEKLVAMGVRPYYLHHPDDARGAQHFRLTLKEGQDLVTQLRQRLPGWALPRYTLEQTGGVGKVDAMNL